MVAVFRSLDMLVLFAAVLVVAISTGASVQAQEIDLDQALAERSLGDPDAPVTMVEHSSFTCPHCAHFHADTLPKIKAAFIDTGKVRLVFSDFPLDRFALTASMLARCANPDRYFSFVDVLFREQQTWIDPDAPLEALRKIARRGGIGDERFNACVNSQELQDGILQMRLQASKQFEVNVTPSFVFNGGAEKMSGAHPFENFARVINSLLPEDLRDPDIAPMPTKDGSDESESEPKSWYERLFGAW